MIYIALPIKHGDFPWQTLELPESKECFVWGKCGLSQQRNILFGRHLGYLSLRHQTNHDVLYPKVNSYRHEKPWFKRLPLSEEHAGRKSHRSFRCSRYEGSPRLEIIKTKISSRAPRLLPLNLAPEDFFSTGIDMSFQVLNLLLLTRYVWHLLPHVLFDKSTVWFPHKKNISKLDRSEWYIYI